MKLFVTKDYNEMSKKAASILAAQVVAKPESILGLATGSTPEGIYQYLIQWYREGLLDFSCIRTFNLDEYKGIDKDDSHGYYYFMQEKLFRHVNIDKTKTHIQEALEQDSEKVCKDYEALITEVGGIDIQLLGIGHNGHIGFNEPDGVFQNECHCVKLAKSTIEANKRFFTTAEDVPREAYTMGIGTIMRAKKIILAVSGADKADILKKVLESDVTPEIPATVLKLHRDVTIVADAAAASACQLR